MKGQLAHLQLPSNRGTRTPHKRCTRDCWLRLLSILLFIGSLFLLFTARTRASDLPTLKARTTAELTGVVATPGGAPLAGATVALENLTTHRRSTAQTGINGVFNLAGLSAGEYRLFVSAVGYKTYSVSQLPLVAGDRARANAIMELGDAGIVVEAKAGIISRAGTALVGKSISDLPENQRNFVNIVQNSAGANEGSTNGSASGSRPGAQHQSSAVSLGGQPETTNNSLIDGIDNNERLNSAIIVHPSVEGIAEVQIYANSYTASLGQAGGGVLNVVSKAGTNRFHGSVYEYLRNDVLDAFPFQFGAKNPKQELRQNQFGGSLGGPIQRDGTWFFGDYEGFRLIQGRAPVELTVPTAYEHDHPGDFTDVGGPKLSNLDPVGLAYFRLYPLPNVAGTSDQFVSVPSGSSFSHVADLRIDRNFSQNDRFYARFSYNRTFVFIPGQFPAVVEDGMTIEPGGSLTSFAGNMDDFGINTVLDYTHAFRPNLSLELKAGYTFWNEADTSLNPHVAVNQGFGQPGINLPGTSNGLAPISIIAASPLGTDGYFRPINQVDNVFQYGGSVAWDRGQHGLAFGAVLLRRQWSNIGSGSGLGMWTVNDLPSLLAGIFVGVQRQVDLFDVHYQTWEPSAYFQDTWKARPGLTLSFGLRYDLLTPPTEAANRLSNFDLNTGRILIAGEDGVSRTAGVRTDHSDVGPRFAFAWEPYTSATLRGGFGIVYFRPLDGFVYKVTPFVYTFGTCSSQTCPAGFTTLADGLPVPDMPDPSNPSGTQNQVRPFDYHNSYIEQFNLDFEQRFDSNTAHLVYVGTLGRRIIQYFPDMNAPPPNTSSNPDLLRPYHEVDPNLLSVGTAVPSAGSSYNALQASVTHTAHNGLTASMNYTLAHGLDNSGAGQTGFGTVPAIASAYDYGNSAFDIRQRLVATVFYDLPFARTATGRKAIALKGWQVNMAGSWSTGLPFTILNANDVSNTYPGASAADRPDQIGRFALRNPGVSKFFNTSAFKAQQPGTLGNERVNQLYGPHIRRIDMSLFKNFQLPKETTLQFRTEVFNATNTANFSSPANILGGANFGQLTQMTAGYTPREIQFALRLQF